MVSAQGIKNWDNKTWDKFGWSSREDVDFDKYVNLMAIELPEAAFCSDSCEDSLTDDNYHTASEAVRVLKRIAGKASEKERARKLLGN